MKRQQSGFTLIELVMVIVILGILSAIAVPRFVDLQTQALDAAQAGMAGAVKSAHAVAIATKQNFPTLDELVNGGTFGGVVYDTFISGENVAIASTNEGVVVDINGTLYMVPTFTDSACQGGNETGATTDVVRCVGSNVVVAP